MEWICFRNGAFCKVREIQDKESRNEVPKVISKCRHHSKLKLNRSDVNQVQERHSIKSDYSTGFNVLDCA